MWIPEEDQITFIQLVWSKPVGLSREQRHELFKAREREHLAWLRVELVQTRATPAGLDRERRDLIVEREFMPPLR
ncbi:hypothetical protein CQ14_16690 [Bradyrhizobium lablabi]|uniref:Uncharacterized protein n=1 Tax=Bradyrhizobium lablabi TaxID=722472 RepID=A0A0R3MGW8_9BRAD|nr:hypothetical protein [Bradyrhizobium lablabi]KRR19465.1 hypothetical protein CQ14_16690 [Bradyrhizobium lablabi]